MFVCIVCECLTPGDMTTVLAVSLSHLCFGNRGQLQVRYLSIWARSSRQEILVVATRYGTQRAGFGLLLLVVVAVGCWWWFMRCRLVDETGQPIGPHRVWLECAWLPGLAMSRALGDKLAHS